MHEARVIYSTVDFLIYQKDISLKCIQIPLQLLVRRTSISLPSSTSLCRPFGCHPKRINIPTVLWANTNRAESAKYFNLSGTPIRKVSTSSDACLGLGRACGATATLVPRRKVYNILIKFPAWENTSIIKENRKEKEIPMKIFICILTIQIILAWPSEKKRLSFLSIMNLKLTFQY